MNNKVALEVEKEKILQELQFCETRKTELLRKISKKQKCEFAGSDSDSDPYVLLNINPTRSQLKTVQNSIQTCVQATQELTGLVVLQSEVQLLMEAPQYVRGPKVKQPGSWREVTAECRIDLVPFSISFYTHRQDRMFTPTLYRGLSVMLSKKGQQMELSKSVLSDIDKPSDAVEVLKSYSKAYRARRTTLAHLADQYPDEIRIEPLTEGGYLLICGSLMRLTWRLENKWRPLSPFNHKMKFDLEYMDESHLKIIVEAHEKLSESSLDIPERTKLLSEIISTCLEVMALYDENMDSDNESKTYEKTILEDISEENCENDPKNIKDLSQNNENGVPKPNRKTETSGTGTENLPKSHPTSPKNLGNSSKNSESVLQTENIVHNGEKEIMAPPKSLPKKTKPKCKENIIDNRKAVKRTANGDPKLTKKVNITGRSDQKIAIIPRQAKIAEIDQKVSKKVPNDKNQVKCTGLATSKKKSNTESSNTMKIHDNVQDKAKKSKLNENQAIPVYNDKILPNDKITAKQNNNPKNDQNKPKHNKQNTNKIEIHKNTNNNKLKMTTKTSTEKEVKIISKHNLAVAKNVDHSKDNKNKGTNPVSSNSTEINSENIPEESQSNKKITINQAKSNRNVADTKKVAEKPKLLIKSTKDTQMVKKSGITGSVKDGKISKIPQKKLKSSSDTNILRMSPRNLPSKFQSSSDPNVLGKMAKTQTNLPMMKKPSPNA